MEGMMEGWNDGMTDRGQFIGPTSKVIGSKKYQIGFTSFIIKMYIPDSLLFITFDESIEKISF